MPNYRRHYLALPVFVTLVTHGRAGWLIGERVEVVLAAMRGVKLYYPFRHIAHVILPDHIHWLFEPEADTDFSKLVSAVKREVTWRMKAQGQAGPLWQNRFYDHLIRDEADLQAHLDYIHFNPVKHGHGQRAADWPHSSFSSWLARGAYPPDWGVAEPEHLVGMNLE
jgi:putative transposase